MDNDRRDDLDLVILFNCKKDTRDSLLKVVGIGLGGIFRIQYQARKQLHSRSNQREWEGY